VIEDRQTVEAAISVRGLHKRYGSFEAVAGIDLEVSQGEIFAFLGPNGERTYGGSRRPRPIHGLHAARGRHRAPTRCPQRLLERIRRLRRAVPVPHPYPH
jgi:hypothetical protein